jgi:hypothetical protein
MRLPDGAHEQINAPGDREHRVTSDLATLHSQLRQDFAELRKRANLILVGVFLHILLQIVIRVFFP